MLDLDWFRLLVEPFLLMGIFLAILAEPGQRLRAWRARRRKQRSAKAGKGSMT